MFYLHTFCRQFEVYRLIGGNLIYLSTIYHVPDTSVLVQADIIINITAGMFYFNFPGLTYQRKAHYTLRTKIEH